MSSGKPEDTAAALQFQQALFSHYRSSDVVSHNVAEILLHPRFLCEVEAGDTRAVHYARNRLAFLVCVCLEEQRSVAEMYGGYDSSGGNGRDNKHHFLLQLTEAEYAQLRNVALKLVCGKAVLDDVRRDGQEATCGSVWNADTAKVFFADHIDVVKRLCSRTVAACNNIVTITRLAREADIACGPGVPSLEAECTFNLSKQLRQACMVVRSGLAVLESLVVASALVITESFTTPCRGRNSFATAGALNSGNPLLEEDGCRANKLSTPREQIPGDSGPADGDSLLSHSGHNIRASPRSNPHCTVTRAVSVFLYVFMRVIDMQCWSDKPTALPLSHGRQSVSREDLQSGLQVPMELIMNGVQMAMLAVIAHHVNITNAAVDFWGRRGSVVTAQAAMLISRVLTPEVLAAHHTGSPGAQALEATLSFLFGSTCGEDYPHSDADADGEVDIVSFSRSRLPSVNNAHGLDGDCTQPSGCATPLLPLTPSMISSFAGGHLQLDRMHPAFTQSVATMDRSGVLPSSQHGTSFHGTICSRPEVCSLNRSSRIEYMLASCFTCNQPLMTVIGCIAEQDGHSCGSYVAHAVVQYAHTLSEISASLIRAPNDFLLKYPLHTASMMQGLWRLAHAEITELDYTDTDDDTCKSPCGGECSCTYCTLASNTMTSAALTSGSFGLTYTPTMMHSRTQNSGPSSTPRSPKDTRRSQEGETTSVREDTSWQGSRAHSKVDPSPSTPRKACDASCLFQWLLQSAMPPPIAGHEESASTRTDRRCLALQWTRCVVLSARTLSKMGVHRVAVPHDHYELLEARCRRLDLLAQHRAPKDGDPLPDGGVPVEDNAPVYFFSVDEEISVPNFVVGNCSRSLTLPDPMAVLPLSCGTDGALPKTCLIVALGETEKTMVGGECPVSPFGSDLTMGDAIDVTEMMPSSYLVEGDDNGAPQEGEERRMLKLYGAGLCDRGPPKKHSELSDRPSYRTLRCDSSGCVADGARPLLPKGRQRAYTMVHLHEVVCASVFVVLEALGDVLLSPEPHLNAIFVNEIITLLYEIYLSMRECSMHVNLLIPHQNRRRAVPRAGGSVSSVQLLPSAMFGGRSAMLLPLEFRLLMIHALRSREVLARWETESDDCPNHPSLGYCEPLRYLQQFCDNPNKMSIDDVLVARDTLRLLLGVSARAETDELHGNTLHVDDLDVGGTRKEEETPRLGVTALKDSSVIEKAVQACSIGRGTLDEAVDCEERGVRAQFTSCDATRSARFHGMGRSTSHPIVVCGIRDEPDEDEGILDYTMVSGASYFGSSQVNVSRAGLSVVDPQGDGLESTNTPARDAVVVVGSEAEVRDIVRRAPPAWHLQPEPIVTQADENIMGHLDSEMTEEVANCSRKRIALKGTLIYPGQAVEGSRDHRALTASNSRMGAFVRRGELLSPLSQPAGFSLPLATIPASPSALQGLLPPSPPFPGSLSSTMGAGVLDSFSFPNTRRLLDTSVLRSLSDGSDSLPLWRTLGESFAVMLDFPRSPSDDSAAVTGHRRCAPQLSLGPLVSTGPYGVIETSDKEVRLLASDGDANWGTTSCHLGGERLRAAGLASECIATDIRDRVRSLPCRASASAMCAALPEAGTIPSSRFSRSSHVSKELKDWQTKDAYGRYQSRSPMANPPAHRLRSVDAGSSISPASTSRRVLSHSPVRNDDCEVGHLNSSHASLPVSLASRPPLEWQQSLAADRQVGSQWLSACSASSGQIDSHVMSSRLRENAYSDSSAEGSWSERSNIST